MSKSIINIFRSGYTFVSLDLLGYCTVELVPPIGNQLHNAWLFFAPEMVARKQAEENKRKRRPGEIWDALSVIYLIHPLSFPIMGGITVSSDTLPASLHRYAPLGEKARRVLFSS